MSTTTMNIEITKRNVSGSKAVRKLRHEGFIPGIIYGNTNAQHEEPILVQINKKELSQICKTTSFSGHIFNVNIDGKNLNVLSREVQYDVVTDEPIHVDFQKISDDTTVKVHIPIEFINEDKSPGIKRGGILNVVMHKIECLCRITNIPEKLYVDLTNYEIGQSLHLNNIEKPKDVSFSHKDLSIVVATIVTSKAADSNENNNSSTNESDSSSGNTTEIN